MTRGTINLALDSIFHPLQTGTVYWAAHKVFKYGGALSTLGAAASKSKELSLKALEGIILAGQVTYGLAQGQVAQAWDYVGVLGEGAWENLHANPRETLATLIGMGFVSYIGTKFTGNKRNGKVWDYEFIHGFLEDRRISKRLK